MLISWASRDLSWANKAEKSQSQSQGFSLTHLINRFWIGSSREACIEYKHVFRRNLRKRFQSALNCGVIVVIFRRLHNDYCRSICKLSCHMIWKSSHAGVTPLNDIKSLVNDMKLNPRKCSGNEFTTLSKICSTLNFRRAFKWVIYMIISTVKNWVPFDYFHFSSHHTRAHSLTQQPNYRLDNFNKIRHKISPSTTHYVDYSFLFHALGLEVDDWRSKSCSRLTHQPTSFFKYVRCIFTSKNSEKLSAFLIPLLTFFLHLIFYFSNVYSITSCNLFSSECFSVSEILGRLTSFLCLLSNFTSRSRWVDFIFQRIP